MRPVTLTSADSVGLLASFGLLDVNDTIYRNTVTRIRDELVVSGGGVRRYLGDTFYGGSEWILLSKSDAGLRDTPSEADRRRTSVNF
jgi:GH15 family glucan-1,4-alpha-glucosidase